MHPCFAVFATELPDFLFIRFLEKFRLLNRRFVAIFANNLF